MVAVGWCAAAYMAARNVAMRNVAVVRFALRSRYKGTSSRRKLPLPHQRQACARDANHRDLSDLFFSNSQVGGQGGASSLRPPRAPPPAGPSMCRRSKGPAPGLPRRLRSSPPAPTGCLRTARQVAKVVEPQGAPGALAATSSGGQPGRADAAQPRSWPTRPPPSPRSAGARTGRRSWRRAVGKAVRGRGGKGHGGRGLPDTRLLCEATNALPGGEWRHRRRARWRRAPGGGAASDARV
jgi:hypothetical protein